MRKPVFGVSNHVQFNGAVQPQKMVRGLKFRIYIVKGLYHLCSETNALVSCAVLRSWSAPLFSYEKAGFLITWLWK